MAFKIIHNIKSELAEQNNINNFPGVDVNHNSTLTYDFIINNLRLLHLNCINPLLADIPDIKIRSAYRCKQLNNLLGGVENSQHIFGYAIDIVSDNFPASLIWNWCYQNLPLYNQLIWEYPERGDFNGGSNIDCSWVHISYIEGDNTKKTSLSTTRKDLHEMYASELTTQKGNFTHGINLADQNLI